MQIKTGKISGYLFIILLVFVLNDSKLEACTGFYYRTKSRVLAGNNEDGCNPETKIWIVPGENGSYGRIYFGYNDLSSQGGINEKGLWYDAFGLPFKSVSSDSRKIYPGDLQDKLMAECATVEEVIQMLNVYNRSAMTRYQWMFGDSQGNSIIVQGDTIIKKQGNYQVVTNFRQSEFPSGTGYECNRFQIASELLKTQTDPDISTFRNILAATHSEGNDVTLYSYIADLTNGLVYVYHFHNFENVVILDIKKELAKGKNIYNLSDLFPRTNAAESFEYIKKSELKKLKESRRDTTFNPTKYNLYVGHFVIISPELFTQQVIDISQGPDCLYLKLNNGGPYEVIPVSDKEFVLLSYGGLEISCRFYCDEKLRKLRLEGSGVLMEAMLKKE